MAKKSVSKRAVKAKPKASKSVKAKSVKSKPKHMVARPKAKPKAAVHMVKGKTTASQKATPKPKVKPEVAKKMRSVKNVVEAEQSKQVEGRELKGKPDVRKLIDVDLTRYELVKSKKLKNLNIKRPEAVKNAINILLNNEQIIDYLKKNVSRVAPDVINMLSTPRTDEYIAAQLDMKINAIRRILNILQGYGITNYYVAKNTNGWLSFAWFINVEKLDPFLQYVNGIGADKSVINEECNDYFKCEKCYATDKLIFTLILHSIWGSSVATAEARCNGLGRTKLRSWQNRYQSARRQSMR